jgi:PAS domain S-box-containing protein
MAGAPGSGPDILMVDDDPDSRTWARVHLQSAGYTVREARSSDEALAAIAARPPDLILLDVMLPGMDGFELTAHLRRNLALVTVPIILITVLDDPGSKVRGLEAGANDFLTKPPERGELLARVRTLLRAKRDQEALLAERNKTALLYRVSRELGSELDLDVTLSRILELTMAAIGATRSSLILLDEQGQVVRHIYTFKGQVTTMNNVASERIVREGLAGWVIRNGESVILPDARQDPRWLAVGYSTFVTRSVLSVPLVHQERVVGVVTLTHEEVGRFTDEHLELLTAITAQAATALANAQLYETVKQERGQLEAILVGTDDVVIATDRALRITLLNPAAQRAFNVNLAEAAGWPLEEVLSLDVLVAAFRHAQAGDGPLRPGEVTLPDGRTLFFTLSAVAARPHGEDGWVAVMQDITHLKQLDRMKNEFISTVSHDLRTPLATIHGFAEVLGKMVEGEARAYTERIKAQARRTTQLVEELLDLGKIESGMETAEEQCALDAIITEAVEAAQFQSESGKVTLRAEVAPLTRPVRGNPIRLRQVVDNLVGNALKYTPAGGMVVVRAWEKEDQVLVTVQDNGIGIPREALPRIFEKFYRVPLPSTAKVSGTGLGLVIVKAIVEQHGGQVWVESEVEAGSTFGFSLPLEG